MIKIRFILFYFVILLLSACSEQADNAQSKPMQTVISETTELCFALYASDKLSSLTNKYLPLLEYIETQLTQRGQTVTRVKFKGYSRYEDGINAIVSGECDFSRVGPASYIIAKQRNPHVRLIAIEQVKHKTTFKGMIVTRIDSPIHHLEDIRGTHFAFGDRNSTIGRYLSQAALISAGIYASDLASYDYLNRHDIVAKSVIEGEHDAGAIKESTFRKFQMDLKVIHDFPNITKPWIARAGLDEQLFKQLQTILLNLKDPKLLKILKKTGFTAPDDSYYDFVRRRMKQAEAFETKP